MLCMVHFQLENQTDTDYQLEIILVSIVLEIPYTKLTRSAVALLYYHIMYIINLILFLMSIYIFKIRISLHTMFPYIEICHNSNLSCGLFH